MNIREPVSGRDTAWAVIAIGGVAAGLLVYLVGLPDSPQVFGTAPSDLTLPTALFLVFAGITIASAMRAHGTGWRVVDIVVASVLGVVGGLLFALWNATAWPVLSGGLGFYPPA